MAWGGAWGSSWGASWGDGGEAETPRRAGDDAGFVRQRRKYRHITAQRLQELLEATPEEQPVVTNKRVRAVKREIVSQIESAGLLGPAKTKVAQFVGAELKQVFVPDMDWPAIRAAVASVLRKAAEEAARIEQELEDEDEMILLMVA